MNIIRTTAVALAALAVLLGGTVAAASAQGNPARPVAGLGCCWHG